MSLDTIADELYGLPPQEFTGARNDRARAARGAGDRALAEQIRGLRKPTVAAWLANQVVRHDRDLIESLLVLGQDLRAATAAPSGQDLRRLNAQQRELLQALQLRAVELAESAGHQASDQVLQGLSDTLRAALADPQAAEALASGRLAQALTPAPLAGWQPLAGPADAAAPTPAPRTAAPIHRERDELADARRRQAERAVAEAQDRAREARRALKDAEASRDRTGSRTGNAAERVERLRAELAVAIADHESAQQAADEARTAHARAELAAHEAEQRLVAARDALASTDTPP